MLSNFSDEKVREMQATAAESMCKAVDENPALANTNCAHIDHRWLRVYRKASKKSQEDIAWEVFGGRKRVDGGKDFIAWVDLIECGEVMLKWKEFRRWAEACGQTGGQISLYYLPFRSAPLRLWDRFEFWLWAKFDWKSEPKSPMQK